MPKQEVDISVTSSKDSRQRTALSLSLTRHDKQRIDSGVLTEQNVRLQVIPDHESSFGIE